MHFKPKKRLGQNFLVDKNIQQKIINACELKSTDTLIEIGAGTGIMTRLLSGRVKELYAVEVDSSLCAKLKEDFASEPHLQIINKDILKFDFKAFLRGRKERALKVFGNIPYYITTPIIERLLEYRGAFESIFLTVQKEFALRVCADPGSKKYGSLSCFIQYYACPEIKFFITKGCFLPRPKVDSCLLKLAIRNEPPVTVKDEKLFFSIIRRAFNQRRKTLKNSLKNIIPHEIITAFFENFSIDNRIRPEQLSLADFARLVNLL